ncbi:hypothetical protein [Streptomyces celluloflavus]|uniref:hypothetical protein n=1 Tax=Streptomyces celluloflavus TaxID=58344 RepID=UPI00345F1DA7|nr:hypothetical protein OG717_30060 [Streptomyces celluloflavus]
MTKPKMGKLMENYVLSLIWGGTWTKEDERRPRSLQCGAQSAGRPHIPVRFLHGHKVNAAVPGRLHTGNQSHKAESGGKRKISQLALAGPAQPTHLATQSH